MTRFRPVLRLRLSSWPWLAALVCLLHGAVGRAESLPAEDARFYPERYYPGVSDSVGAEVLVLAPGEGSGHLELPMDAAGGVIEGQVLGETDGGPVPLDGVLIAAWAGSLRSLARSGADGRFRVTGVPAGTAVVRYSTDTRYSLSFRHEARFHPGVRDRAAAERVAVSEGGTVSLEAVVLPPAAVLAGSIRAGDTGASIPGAEVRIRALSDSSSWTVRTARDGSFLLGGLPGGSYLLQALTGGTLYIPEFYGGSRDAEHANVVSVEAGEERNGLEIRPDRGATIGGVIHHESGGEGINAIDVLATDVETGAVYKATTDDVGAYRLIGLPTGSYRIQVPAIHKYYRDTPFENEAKPIAVVEPEDVFPIDLRGRPGRECLIPPGFQGAIRGIVTADLSGVTHAFVRAFSDQDTAETELAFPGPYVLDCLPGGLYKVAFLTDGPLAARYYPDTGRLSEALPVTVVEGDTVQGVDFRPEASIRLEGRVYDRATGAPLPGVGVVATGLDSRIPVRGVADGEGAFVLDRLTEGIARGTGLPAGRWRVLAESTLIPDPALTPVLQPSLEALDAGSGRIVIRWHLAPGIGWRYRLVRTAAADTAGVLLSDGEIGPADPESAAEYVDTPPGAGPFRYRLTAWIAAPGPAEPFVTDSGWIFPSAPGDHAGRLSIRVYPLPWAGTGPLTFAMPEALGEGGRLRILSPSGRVVAVLAWPPEDAKLPWSGSGLERLASGCYYFRCDATSGRYGKGAFLLFR